MERTQHKRPPNRLQRLALPDKEDQVGWAGLGCAAVGRAHNPQEEPTFERALTTWD